MAGISASASAWVGVIRIDQPQADLGISRKVLTERLNHVVDQGVLERHPYDRRPRHEYHLTAKGAELVELLMVMVGWGNGYPATPARPCSTAIMHAVRSAVPSRAAPTAANRCTQATSTCCRARAQPRDRDEHVRRRRLVREASLTVRCDSGTRTKAVEPLQCERSRRLPREVWIDGYYDALAPRAGPLPEHDDPQVREFAAETSERSTTCSDDSYGYVFYVLQRR